MSSSHVTKATKSSNNNKIYRKHDVDCILQEMTEPKPKADNKKKQPHYAPNVNRKGSDKIRVMCRTEKTMYDQNNKPIKTKSGKNKITFIQKGVVELEDYGVLCLNEMLTAPDEAKTNKESFASYVARDDRQIHQGIVKDWFKWYKANKNAIYVAQAGLLKTDEAEQDGKEAALDSLVVPRQGNDLLAVTTEREGDVVLQGNNSGVLLANCDVHVHLPTGPDNQQQQRALEDSLQNLRIREP